MPNHRHTVVYEEYRLAGPLWNKTSLDFLPVAQRCIDIHDLILARSSAGKLAKLLLSWSPPTENCSKEIRVRYGLTHEEMVLMIGGSRETVTRLLSELQKKQLIRLEGSTLVIRNRTALEALVS